jgi:CRISPR/Cas system-associated exonuclease Cas4 (RecB family)
MATLPQEQITVRSHTADVSVSFDGQKESPSEKVWLATRTGYDTVVDTKATASDQKDPVVFEARLQAAGAAAYPPKNLHSLYGYGDQWVP